MKKLTLFVVMALGVLITNFGFGQTVIDGFDYPFGDRGYDSLSNEYELLEHIDPETNNIYPDNPIATPNRQCTVGCGTGTGWHNQGDVCDYYKTGLHPGEDWNYLNGEADSGKIVYATANGIVVAIKAASATGIIDYAGWTVVLKHFSEDGNYYHSIYTHVTSYSETGGAMVYTPLDFTISVGEWVMRGQPIARIGKGYTAPPMQQPLSPHLHFEIRDSLYDYVSNGGVIFPRDNNRGYYGGDTVCLDGCNTGTGSGIDMGGMTVPQVENAFTNMQLDGIVDASDFVDQHRPSFYTETPCIDPPIVWQNTIGGNGYDLLYAINQTNDGGYILGGESRSELSGDQTEEPLSTPILTGDYWVVKLNAAGDSIEWKNRIGGSGDDKLFSINQTSDGGYILGGYSNSDISGDKDENGLGNSDYWVVKLNHQGDSIEWQNTIGGTDNDLLWCVKETADGNYILVGSSYSGISGDKDEPSFGNSDYWIIKLNHDGNTILWQKTIGGSNYDQAQNIVQTDDGGFIIIGTSQSNVSGNKTQVSNGGNDYWVVKLNAAGDSIEWQRVFGGISDDYGYIISKTSEGGYIIGGYSSSDSSGNKTEHNRGFGTSDYWIVKTDNTGNKEWDKTIGGSATDGLRSVSQTEDGGYLLCGSSNSSISGDKDENLIGPAIGSDYWIVKLDNTGQNIEWQNTIGGTSDDVGALAIETSDGNYVLGGSSKSEFSGDKNEPSQGDYDYWILKLSCGETCPPETVTISADGPTVFCQGGNVVLEATYSGTSVQWQKNGTDIPGATSASYVVTQKGTYSATTSGECGDTMSNSIDVNVQNNPNATIIAGGPTTFCAGDSVVLTANTGAGLSYQWYKGGTTIPGATSINYTATLSGNYRCIVTKVTSGCSKASNVIAVSITCREGENGYVSVYPNPTADMLHIQTEDYPLQIVITNMLGQTVYSNTHYEDETIPVKGWPVGIYSVTTKTEQYTKTVEVVVE